MTDYALCLYAPGTANASEELLLHIPAHRVTFPSGLATSRAAVDVAPTATWTATVAVNGASKATITAQPGNLMAAVAAAEAFTVIPGNRLTVTAPASADATLAGLALTLVGVRDESGRLLAVLDATESVLSGCLVHPQLYAILDATGSGLSGRLLPANTLYAILDASTAQVITARLSDAETLHGRMLDDDVAELVGLLTVTKDASLYL